jgi:hypothetical protein
MTTSGRLTATAPTARDFVQVEMMIFMLAPGIGSLPGWRPNAMSAILGVADVKQG